MASAADAGAAEDGNLRLAQVIVRESIVVRLRRQPGVPGSSTKWKEKHAPKCLDLADVAGAAVAEPSSVDFILRGGKRLRAKLEKQCPALDYYSGFYMRPSEDGQICADRDLVRTRSGGSCMIERFRKLVPDTGK
ncbi:hypothetical protein [Sphingomonas sp. ID0503]|uniref:hypothetical protein n=1 Tax=Sphingomonas sp. ID0503 TaxID=3399691 RepID=UPI003AFAC5B0